MAKWILAVGAAVLASACAAPGMGGMGQTGGMTAAQAQATHAQMLAAQQQGAAAAIHPGDDKLDCAALQAEQMALMQDPAFKANMAAMTSRAQAQSDAIKAAQAGKPLPNGADAARQAQGDKLATANNTMAMMPNAMRAQHLTELAQAKKCAFVKGMPPAH